MPQKIPCSVATDFQRLLPDGEESPPKNLAWFAAVFMPLTIWILFVLYCLPNQRISIDSAVYIESAQKFVEGRGFLVRQCNGLSPQLWGPMLVFPPGYPVLTAGLMYFGLDDAYLAAKAVAIGCSFIFVLLVLVFYANHLRPLYAALLGTGFVIMASLLSNETMCRSEPPFMLFSTISLLALLKGTPRGAPAKWGWICIAGIAGGYAWCIRNIGVALFLATIVYLSSQMPRLRLRKTAIATCVWLMGWLIGSGWMILQNLWMFHTINPYSYCYPPSKMSLARSLFLAIQAIGEDITQAYSLFVNEYVLLVVVVIIFVLAGIPSRNSKCPLLPVGCQ